MVDSNVLRRFFESGLGYDAYVATGTPDQQASWHAARERVRVTDAQRALVASFTRRVNVLTISGTWCGDCVHQVPMIGAIAAGNPGVVQLRLVDREVAIELSNQVKICGGNRVPTVLFLNEDFEFLSIYGDKSLARLRAQAAKAIGASCMIPSAGLGADEASATLQDWVNEFERAHLIARLSAKLRQRHGD